ncbi:MAG: hypothetical protein R2932_16815 [Caldilineaceae bacterium]
MPDYWNVVTGSIDSLYRRRQAALLVRHLLMPGHFDCCTVPVLHWLAARPGIEVSLLTQYVAPAHAQRRLAAQLDDATVGRAAALAQQLSLVLDQWVKPSCCWRPMVASWSSSPSPILSMTGFGSALISIPLLALLFDLKVVVPLEAILEVAISVLLLHVPSTTPSTGAPCCR